MKYLLGVSIILMSTSLFASDYIFKIKKNLDPVTANKLQVVMSKHKLKFKAHKRSAKLSEKAVIELSKTGAFSYIEKDQVIKAPIVHDSDLDNETTKVNSKSKNKRSFRFSRAVKGWHLDKINAKKAWKETKGDPRIVIAFCDSGIDKRKSVFKNKILKGYNFIGRNSNTSHYMRNGRPNTHGTSVAAFIAADYTTSQKNGGVAPDVSLLPGLITNSKGSTTTSRIINCIEWAARKGAKAINVSITGSTSRAARSAARDAFKKGSIVVWSSGNGNQRLNASELDEMVVVGGTDINNDRYLAGSYGSSYGKSLDVMAPGEGVYKPWGSHSRTNGTSYSAPIVSGAIGLLYSYDPNLTPEEVVSVLKSSAKKLGNSEYFGAGIIDVAAAIEKLKTR